jgi:hypothetical protein
MAETKRLGPWGWFVRAFAAGFGATFGVIVASVIACAVSYALVAAGVVAFTSLGGIEINTADTPAPLTPESSTTSAPAFPTRLQHPAYPTTVQPAPPVAGPYAPTGAPYAGSAPNATDGVPSYPAASGDPVTGEADNQPPGPNAQPVPPDQRDPFQPITSPQDGSSAAPE